ncbi:MAG: LysM peptidoglycan-binding domain-containing protein [Anaerolineaceae bacterium]
MLQTAERKIIITGIILVLWVGIMGANPSTDSVQVSRTATLPHDPNVMSPTPTKAPMSADNLIKLVNRARVSHGLPALTIDPILMLTAQTTADIMAGNLMTGHIGDVKSRVMAAGYGVGDIPWATENFVVLPLGAESRILVAWADETHQIPMVNPNYRHVGAGVAVVDDTAYYVLHAAYTSNKIYEPGTASPQGVTVKNLMSEYMYPVLTVTPRPDGKVVHVVKSGQTMWGIAIAYNTHIIDIQQANNLPQTLEMVYNGQELVIPIPAALQNTPQPTLTLTQMVVFTETPIRQSQQEIIDQQMITPSEEESAVGVSTKEDLDQTRNIIQYSIAGAIAFGLLLIIIGAISGKKKDQG